MGAVTVLAAAVFPAAAATARSHPLSALAFGWGVVVGVVLLILRWFVRLLKGKKLCTLTGTPGSS